MANTLRALLPDGTLPSAARAEVAQMIKESAPSGVTMVAGTVSLTSEDQGRPPFVVATTAGATVQGVTLNANQMAAFWYFGGAWQVMVHGQDSTWRNTAAPDNRTAITPIAPTFTNSPTGGGTWTTTAQPGIAYSPASGTAVAGQTVTVTASITDSAQYRFATGATTSWTHTFFNPNGPVSDDFSGAAGPLAGRSTPTGGLTWATSGASPGWKLTGDGGIIPTDTSAGVSNINTLPTVTNVATVSIAYSGRVGRFDIGFGDHGFIQASITQNGEVTLYVNGGEAVKAAGFPGGASGTVGFSYNGSVAKLIHNGTEVGSATVTVGAIRPFQIRSQGLNTSVRLDNLSITGAGQ